MSRFFDFGWKDFFLRLYKKSDDADIFSRAAQTAFYFSFAIFPLLFFLVSLFGLLVVSAEALKREIFEYLGQIMPGTVFDLVQKTIEEIGKNSSGGKLTFGLVITLWSASAGVDAIRSALNAVYGLRESRNWLLTKAGSLGMTFVFTILASAVLAIVFYGWQLTEVLLDKCGLEISSPFVLVGIQWLSILLVMLFACEVIYNLLPNFSRFRWKWIMPGSLVAIALWLIFTSVFRVYITYYNTYDKAYGSLGAVMILMLWLYLTALVVMIGGAINSVISDMRVSETETD